MGYLRMSTSWISPGRYCRRFVVALVYFIGQFVTAVARDSFARAPDAIIFKTGESSRVFSTLKNDGPKLRALRSPAGFSQLLLFRDTSPIAK